MHLLAPLTAGAASGHTYFNCGHSGHFARECPGPKKNGAQGYVTHPPRGPQKVVVAKTGRINYTTIEDVPEDEQVLASMFSLNGHPLSFNLILVPLMTSSVELALKSINQIFNIVIHYI
jgi:hypothetical protein